MARARPTRTTSSSSSSSTSLLLLVVVVLVTLVAVVEANWCVSKSNVSQKQLQTALDYACGAGADCAPIQSSGLCFLPNTLESHASYAFNSYYQRKSNAPGSCDFSGSATIAVTDPSYGSCVYPSSSSNAGGGSPTPVMPTPTPPGTIIDPNAPPTVPPPPGSIGITPVLGPSTFGPDPNGSPLLQSPASMIFFCGLFISYLLLVF